MATDDEPPLGLQGFDQGLIKDVQGLASKRQGFIGLIKFCLPGKAKKALDAMAPRFMDALQTALRVAIWSWFVGIVAWLLRKHLIGDFKVYKTQLGGLMIAVIFNATDDLASSVRNAMQGLAGTLTAILFSSILYAFPDPFHGGDVAGDGFTPVPPDCDTSEGHMYEWQCFASSNLVAGSLQHDSNWYATNLVAFGFFGVFSAIVLSLNVVLPFKMFSLLGGINFMLNFANPGEETAKYMDLTLTSNMGVLLVLQVAGSLVAILAVLLPPRTSSNKAKILASRVTLGTVEVLAEIATYYCGDAKTLRINIFNSSLGRMQKDLDEEVEKLDQAWWEYFDWGRSGIIRYLMLHHLDLIKDLDRRIAIMQDAIRAETFDQEHKEAMSGVKSHVAKVVSATGNLLLSCTAAASDGEFDDAEQRKLKTRQEDAKTALGELARMWKKSRSTKGRTALSRALRTESFFLLELSTVTQQVIDYSNQVIDDDVRPKPGNIAIKHLKKTIDWEKLKDPEFRNFVGRTWISLAIGWWWAVLAYRYDGTIIVNIVFMMSMIPGNVVMMNLQKLQALVLGALAGVTVYRAFNSCVFMIKMLKLLCLFFYVLGTMFIARYSPEFATVGLLLAVTGSSKLLAPCEEHPLTYGQVANTQAAEFKALKKFAFSIMVVTIVDMIMKPEAVGKQVQTHLITALDLAFTNLTNCLEMKVPEREESDTDTDTDPWKQSQKDTDKVIAALDKVEQLIGAADSEPRFDKCRFKKTMVVELVSQIRTLQFHVMCMVRRSESPQTEEGGVVKMLSEMGSFKNVKEDLTDTIKATKDLTTKVVEYDGFVPMDEDELGPVINRGDLGRLTGVDELMKEFQTKHKELFKDKDESTLDEDIVSRVCVVAEMMERIKMDLRGLLQISVANL